MPATAIKRAPTTASRRSVQKIIDIRRSHVGVSSCSAGKCCRTQIRTAMNCQANHDRIPQTNTQTNASQRTTSMLSEKRAKRFDAEPWLKLPESAISANRQITKPTALNSIRVQGVFSILGFGFRRIYREGLTNT